MKQAHKRLAEQHESIRAGDIIVLRTDWAQRAIGTPTYFPRLPGLTQSAASWLVEKRPKWIEPGNNSAGNSSLVKLSPSCMRLRSAPVRQRSSYIAVWRERLMMYHIQR